MLLEGAGLIDVGRADDAARLHRPAVALVPLPEREPRAPHRGRCSSTISDAGGGYGTWQVELQPQSATAGAMIDLPAVGHAHARRRHAAHRGRAGVGRRRRRRRLRLHRPAQRRRRRAGSRTSSRSSGPASSRSRPRSSRRFQIGDTRSGGEQGERLPLAGRAVRAAGELHRPAASTRTAPSSSTSPTSPSRPSTSASPSSLQTRQLADRPVLPRLARRERRHRATPGTPVERERLPLRLPRRRPGRRDPVPAPGPVLRLGRLRAQRVHRPDRSPAGTCCTAWLNDVSPPLAAMMTTTRRGRTADDRRADARPPVRRRPALARDRLRPRAGRRCRVRPGLRLRDLPAPRVGARR